MKRIFVLITVVAFATASAFSQTGPKIEFASSELDYGTILQGSDPLRVFSFKNVGDQPLIITSAHGTCGCTVPSYPKEPILPGQTGKIEIRYDTNRIGTFQKVVNLTTNETQNTHVLLIKGVVNAKPSKEGVPTAKRGFGK
jgi:hypothetical protein